MARAIAIQARGNAYGLPATPRAATLMLFLYAVFCGSLVPLCDGISTVCIILKGTSSPLGVDVRISCDGIVQQAYPIFQCYPSSWGGGCFEGTSTCTTSIHTDPLCHAAVGATCTGGGGCSAGHYHVLAGCLLRWPAPDRSVPPLALGTFRDDECAL